MKTIQIESASIEPILVTVAALDDPTGVPIEFVTTELFDAEGDPITSPAGTWVAGSWDTWGGGNVTATTPTLGAAGAQLVHAEGDRVILWCRIAGTVVLRAARIIFN